MYVHISWSATCRRQQHSCSTQARPRVDLPVLLLSLGKDDLGAEGLVGRHLAVEVLETESDESQQVRPSKRSKFWCFIRVNDRVEL